MFLLFLCYVLFPKNYTHFIIKQMKMRCVLIDNEPGTICDTSTIKEFNFKLLNKNLEYKYAVKINQFFFN